MPNKLEIKLPSNRSFGIVFFLIFLIIALWPLKNGEELRLWSMFLSLIFFILGLLNSKFLTPLNKIWIKLGVFLGTLASPVMMGIVYFFIVTPISILMRSTGKDFLKMSKKKKTTVSLLLLN